jgi:phage terminase large subunit-like protein
MREMECKIVSKETRTFRAEWLQRYEILPEGCIFYMTIDPAVSDREDASYQAVAIIAVLGRRVYLVEYELARGQTLAELAANTFRLYTKYRPIMLGVETFAYQKVCAWYLKEESFKRGIFLPITEIEDRRPKDARIIDSITSVASTGNLYVQAHHHEFIRDFADFPDPTRKDLLDCVAMAIKLRNPAIAGMAVDASVGAQFLLPSKPIAQPNRSCP